MKAAEDSATAAILLLQQDGKLQTSDPIGRFYINSPGKVRDG